MSATTVNETEFQTRIIGTYSTKQKGFDGGLAQVYGWKVQHVEKVTMRGHGGRMLTKTPGTKGYPDLTLARKGVLAFIELKSEENQAEPEQIEWLRSLAGLGDDRWLEPERWRSRGAIPDGFVFCDYADEPVGWIDLERMDKHPPDDWYRLVALCRPRHWEWLVKVLR